MDWKELFRPTFKKVILFLILMGGINYYVISTFVIIDAQALVGVPLGFYPLGSTGLLLPGQTPPPALEFSVLNFVVDIIFWYIVSALIWLGIERFRK